MIYEKFGENTKKKMIKNLWAAMEDAEEMVRAFVKHGRKAFKSERNKTSDELFGKLNFVYLSTNLVVTDKDYKEIQKNIFRIGGLMYYDLKEG